MCVSVQFNREDGSGSGFGSWKTVLAVPVPRSVPGKAVPMVPVSGSGSVPGQPCSFLTIHTPPEFPRNLNMHDSRIFLHVYFPRI